MAYPLLVELDDMHRGSVTSPGDDPTALSITAVAEDIEVFADDDAFTEHAETAQIPYAAKSLVPSGMFNFGDSARPPRAEAMVTGIVVRAERKTNTYSGAVFDWCELETYAATLDVVAEPQAVPFAVGQVVHGGFWLVGRRLHDDDPEPPARRRLFSRR